MTEQIQFLKSSLATTETSFKLAYDQKCAEFQSLANNQTRLLEMHCKLEMEFNKVVNMAAQYEQHLLAITNGVPYYANIFGVLQPDMKPAVWSLTPAKRKGDFALPPSLIPVMPPLPPEPPAPPPSPYIEEEPEPSKVDAEVDTTLSEIVAQVDLGVEQ